MIFKFIACVFHYKNVTWYEGHITSTTNNLMLSSLNSDYHSYNWKHNKIYSVFKLRFGRNANWSKQFPETR